MSRIAAALFLWLRAAVPVVAQNAGDLPLVGYLRINTSDGNEPMAMLYRSASAALGWVDGRNVRIPYQDRTNSARRVRPWRVVERNESIYLWHDGAG